MFLGILTKVEIHAVQEVPYVVMLHERLYSFSNHYEIDSSQGFQGHLTKSKLALRTSYEYYDKNGKHEASSYLRMFSLGSIYTWAGVLDVYDSEGKRIGLIEGAILTLLPSKFNIYDANNDLIAIAYMDIDHMGFTVCDSLIETKIIANFHRIFIKDVTDHWVITVNDSESIDNRLIYSFGAFVLDNQNDFRIDD